MIADLKPYAEHKESGLPWLGRVPTSWKVVPNRALFSEVNERNHPEEQMLSVTITRGIIKQKTLLEGSSKKDASNQNRMAYKLVCPNDIAYNKMRAWQGAIGVSSLRGIISPAYVVMRLRDSDDLPRYFHHLYRTPHFAKEAERWSYGITSDMWSLRPEHFRVIYSPKPPPAEQAAIVRFLGWATGQLDRAIRAKRKVIALLNEQKQAIIHRAVTRGLDPSVPLKDSGVPWLGEIPAHWEVRRLISLASFRSGKAHENFVAPDGRFICVTARFVSTGGTAIKRCTECACPAAPGDVLMVMSDLPNGRALARAYLIRDEREYAVNQRVCALTPRGVEPRFLAYFANRNWHLLRHDDGLNQTHLSNYDFKTMPTLVPSAAEQTEIADFLDEHCGFADSTSGRLEREIELLREYRTRLIADVVTGKLDVRNAAARLTDASVIEPSEGDAELDDEPETEEAAV